MDINDSSYSGPRSRAFYFQGLPVQAYQPSALVTALERYVDLEPIRYFCWLDQPAKENLDIAPRMEAAFLEVVRLQPSGEINLLGYSNGGYAAMYVARRLIEHGRKVGFVALLDSSSYFPFKSEPTFKQRLAARGDMGLGRLLGLHLLVVLLRHRHFELARWLTRLAVRLRGRQAAGDLISKTLAVFWQEAVLRCPPRLYGGKINLFVAERGRPRITDPFLGWGLYAGQIERVVLKGDHWSLTEEPLAPDNAHSIARTLGLPIADEARA